MVDFRTMKVKTISGYDLAKAIFDECGRKNVDALVDFAGGETDWLEFKAGLYARPEHCKPGQKPDDQVWFVARAVFGFLNSSGGLLILGIDDKMDPVGLSGLAKPDKRNDKKDSGNDGIIRCTEEQLPPVKPKWTMSEGTWKWDKATYRIPNDSVTFYPAKYRGQDVVLAFVRPVAPGKIVCISKEREGEVAYVRLAGGRGRLQKISGYTALKEWAETERSIEREDFASELTQFKQARSENLRPKAKTAVFSGRNRGTKKSGRNSESAASRKPTAKKHRPSPGIVFPCPECGSYVPGNGKNGDQRCIKCGKTFHCGVYEENFVSQPDDDSSGWAVAKWLLLSFGYRVSDSDLRRQLNVEKTLFNGVTGDDFEDVLNRCKLDVETMSLSKNDLNIGDPDLCETFSSDGLVAVEYATDRALFPETRGATRWIGLERTNKGVVRVMDPWFAYGYLELQDWKNVAFDDVRAIVKAFSVFEKE